MKKYNHRVYCSDLCSRLKFFNPGRDEHLQVFFESPNSDNLEGVSQQLSQVSFPIMIAVNGLDSDFASHSADALWKDTEYFILILKPAREDDINEVLTAQSECETIATQIQGQLLREMTAYSSGLTALQEDSFTIRSVGPLGINLYGVILGYNVVTQTELCKKMELWQ